MTRCGYVALLGVPNAGKSTLINALVGTKVSIVSRKVQTTRFSIRGIVQEGEAQVIFVDTPGIFAPKRRLDRAMVHAAWSGAKDADYATLLIDVQRGFDAENKALAEQLKERGVKSILALTKIDTVPRDTLLALADEGQKLLEPEAVFMLSATKKDGLKDFISFLSVRMPKGPWLFPDDQPSDLPLRLLAAEVTREKLFDRLHDELPYSLTVTTDNWQQQKDGSIRVDQTVFVERDGQKKIVLGKGGAMIKAIGSASRIELCNMLEAKVHLFLHVKTRENWSDDPEHYRDVGLDFMS